MTWWNRRNTKAITTLVKQIAALTAMLTVLSWMCDFITQR